MAKKALVGACICLMVGALLYFARPIFGCAPGFPEPIFTFSKHPDFPFAKFAKGELGILQPTYARSYLYVAYRHLVGTAFDEDEQKVLVEFWNERLRGQTGVTDENLGWAKKWLEERINVTGTVPPPYIEAYRSSHDYPFFRDHPEWFFNHFPNCLEDAFHTAVTTLQKRIEQFGADSPEVRDWLQGQDQVFANCKGGDPISGEPYLPAPAPPEIHPLIRADRTYQIAAAYFYAGEWSEARRRFDEIALDSSSPWWTIAPYLATRALVRNATLAVSEGMTDSEMLALAEARLERILADMGRPQIHPAAQRLRALVLLRLHPRERASELAQSLLKKKTADGLKQDLWDYLVALDKFVGDDSEYEVEKILNKRAQKFSELSDIRGNDNLTDWILSFQAPGQEALEHSIRKWEEKASLPWLVAAVAKVGASDPKVPALLAAAEQLPPNSPAYTTVAFHQLRLLYESGKKEEARAKLDTLLAVGKKSFAPSTLNLLLALRTKLARNLDEFLRFAARFPAMVISNMWEGRELPYELKDVTGLAPKAPLDSLFDADVARVLTERMPLSLLKTAATREVLAGHLRSDLALAAWTRAVLLDDTEVAKQLLPLFQQFQPALKAHFEAYASAETPEARHFAGIHIILRFPGLRPYVRAGTPRTTSVNMIDNYRDNWWCSLDPKAEEDYPSTHWYQAETIMSAPLQTLYPDSKIDFPDFMSEAHRTAARQEWERLKVMPTAPNYLTQQVIEWANVHPDDARVPEALHLAVRSTRYGCVDKETSKFSRAAFRLLHRRYPKSVWTKKTPHWF